MELISLNVIKYFTLPCTAQTGTWQWHRYRSIMMRLLQPLYLRARARGVFVVGNGDERLDTVLVALVNDIIVELQARLVGLCFLAGGENAAPRNGKAVDLEPHARKELDVLFVAVVVINAFQLEVVGGRLLGDDLEALGQHILDGQALAIFQIGTLALICGRCAAPEEISREIHTGSSPNVAASGDQFFFSSRNRTNETIKATTKAMAAPAQA